MHLAPRRPRALLLLVGALSPGCTAQLRPSTSAPPTVYLVGPAALDLLPSRRPVTVVALLADDRQPAPELAVAVVVDGVLLARPIPTSEGRVEASVTVGAGEHTLSVIATDDQGLRGEDTVTFTVDGTPGLTQPSVVIDPANPGTDEALGARLSVASVDPEGDPITYVWSWTRDGLDAGVTTPTVEAGWVVEGEIWSVEVYATDGAGVSPIAADSVVVTNAPPTAGDVVLTPGAPTARDDLTCTADEPVDPEGDAFTSSWIWRVDDVDIAADTATLPHGSVRRGQTVRCGLAFIQEARASTTLSAPSTVVNSAPSLSGVVVAPGAPTAESGATCVVLDPDDGDGDPLTVTVQWRVGGRPAGAGVRLDGTAYMHGQALSCEVQLTDPYGGRALAESDTVIAADTAPGAPVVVVATPTVVPGDVARCEVSVDAADVDGDPVSYRWQWAADGDIIGDQPALDTTGLPAGTLLTCTATATDGTADGGSAEASVTLVAPTSGVVDAASAWLTIHGTVGGGGLGHAMAAAGDVDGDGIGDLLVSAPGGAPDGRGAVYLYGGSRLALGGAVNEADAAQAWTGPDATEPIGASVVNLGDTDGDTLPDFAVGATGAGDGTVYILPGGAASAWGAGIAASAVFTVRGGPGAALGAAVAGTDLDGDGLADLVLGAPGIGSAGTIAVWSGGLLGEVSVLDADAWVLGDTDSGSIGAVLAPAGDPDGDGYADLVVGLPEAGGLDAGAAAVLSGASLGDGVNDAVGRLAYLSFRGETPGGRVGAAVSGPGDLDGDGVADIAIGAPSEDGGGVDAGAVYIVYGVPGMNREIAAASADAFVLGDTTGGELGAFFAAGPSADVDHDGFMDLLVAAPGAATAGALLIVRGGGLTVGTQYLGTVLGDRLGESSVSGLDVDADGFVDPVVGAPEATTGTNPGGVVYLFRGP